MSLVAEHALDKRVYELLTEKRQIIKNTVEMARQVNPDVNVTDLDLETMAAKARKEAEIADKAREEAKKLAEEREKHFAEAKDRTAAKEKDRKEQAKNNEKERKARERAEKRGWVAPAEAPERHEAQTARQRWAHDAILQLTADDQDHASKLNGVGFSKADGSIGHWLSTELSKGLTPHQWGLAVLLCTRYHAQVGEMPPKDKEDDRSPEHE